MFRSREHCREGTLAPARERHGGSARRACRDELRSVVWCGLSEKRHARDQPLAEERRAANGDSPSKSSSSFGRRRKGHATFHFMSVLVACSFLAFFSFFFAI